jgi:cytochrome c oxidase assembly factor CtaG
VYGLALTNDTAHEAEHAAYLASALLMWAPLLGVDPLPHRAGARGQAACLTACMVPMLLVGAWLGLEPHAVYHHYVGLGPTRAAAALHDQRLAATIMWAGGLPAFAVPAMLRYMSPRRRSPAQPAWWRRSAPTAT